MSGSNNQNNFQTNQKPNDTNRVNQINYKKSLKHPQTDRTSQISAKDKRMPVFEKFIKKPVDLNKFTELKFQSSQSSNFSKSTEKFIRNELSP